ncbi:MULTISPECIES: type II secretion system F family protein [Bifidobacterium]|jgi:tight adherence protein B|uniref:Pilus assembly protein n=1 Tax=Bifidobacterium tibiigranuli TaxID=2172043 RepID=A0A5N6RVP9_9BIFI|nr:hypothetical protein [Bifidobacterium tibiigranuli]KAE8126340.1 hypothetical protein DDE84_11310 [Bifidobacterium tibiigranuli]KAE8126382.1 hypothetical protein DDF78_11170 [Bifidobacterium tibiigranuli]MCI1210240.1 hypothetical protein [Bifidobacterium tibiigranuli]MCI1220580.1 hypothetical protein [Bifidobacterium tibiigranuli]MCI1232410.1 hypothetical protein [Bifidobacterium tibiigranuli]
MIWTAWAAAGCIMAAAWLLAHGNHSARERLNDLDCRWSHPSIRQEDALRIGLAAALASMHARVRSGSSLRQSLQLSEAPGGATLARAVSAEAVSSEKWMKGMVGVVSTGLDYEGLRRMLRARAFATESDSRVGSTAAELQLAYHLSERLGCEAARSIQAVAQSHRHARMVQGLRDNAFAMPQATIKLLSALPFVTLILGEVLGADPIGFLFGSAGGMACLLIGMLSYMAGMLWVRAMLRSFVRPSDAHPVRDRKEKRL